MRALLLLSSCAVSTVGYVRQPWLLVAVVALIAFVAVHARKLSE